MGLWKASFNLTAVVKYTFLLSALTALVIVAGLNIAGSLNLNIGNVGYTFLMVFSVLVFVLALHTTLKTFCCFLVSLWADIWRHAINLRLLLLNCYTWVDFDDWQELGPWTVVPFGIFLVPVFLAAFAPYGFSYRLVYGPVTNFTGDSAGLGGQEGSFAKILTSIELMPNETRRVYSQGPNIQDPRFFCRSTSNGVTVFNSTVHIPAWPYPQPNYMGDQGQRVTVTGIEAFTFNSTCTTERPNFFLGGFSFNQLDAGDQPPSNARVGQRLDKTRAGEVISLSFYQEYRGPYYGNMTCRSTIKRARMGATWVINSTGYYLVSCFGVAPYPFTGSSVNLSMVDYWLNLTTRNTIKNIAYPVWADATAATDAAGEKVIFSLVHLVTWLFASSRTGDPTHSTANSPDAGQVLYSVQPIYAYYSTNSVVFGLLLTMNILLLVSLCLRFVPHGFHGGSVAQLLQMCKNVHLPGWNHDLFTRNLGRAATSVEVLLDEDNENFQPVSGGFDVPRPNRDDVSRRTPSMVGERDFSEASMGAPGTSFMNSTSSELQNGSHKFHNRELDDI